MPLINYIGNRQEALGGGPGGVVRGAAPAPPSLSVDYLIVGGGSATYLVGTGGSGGGIISGSTSVVWNSTLGITVGTGSNDLIGPKTAGSSSISGSSFGFYGAGGADDDNSGWPQNFSAGLGGPGNTSGGGAGSSKNGNDGVTGQNGDGGTGSVWLNGIYYAGGGGGIGDPAFPSNPGNPGLGGGGYGTGSLANGVDGLGGGASGAGSKGGNGVVIIRYPNTVPRMGAGGNQFESGGFYYHQFTGSGQFTYQF